MIDLHQPGTVYFVDSQPFFSIPHSLRLSAMFGPSSYNCAVCHHIRQTQNCNIAQDTTRRPAAQTTGALSASMGDVLPENAVQSLLKSVVPGFVVKRLDLVPDVQVRRVYNIESPNGDRVQLAFPPHPSVKLLRTERSPIRSEAATIEFLSQCCQRGEQAAKTKDPNINDHHVNEDVNPSPHLKDPLLAFLPELIEHASLVQQSNEATEFSLTRPTPGEVATSLSPPLSILERESVNYQAGNLLRQISTILSPNKRFGATKDVLSSSSQLTNNEIEAEGGVAKEVGASCWSEGFLTLLEATLRDLEDKFVQINYVSLRGHCDRFRHLLDAVTRPSIVPLNIGEDSSLLVVQQTASNLQHNPRNNDAREASSPQSQDSRHIRVTGLLDWSQCIFGDPLVASSFCDRSTGEFQRGFTEAPEQQQQGKSASTPIEDQGHAHVRLHLYECLHAIRIIAKEFMKPKKHVFEAEMAARKRLVDALKNLDELDDSGHPKHDAPTAEASPAKKPRIGDVPREPEDMSAECEGGDKCIHKDSAI